MNGTGFYPGNGRMLPPVSHASYGSHDHFNTRPRRYDGSDDHFDTASGNDSTQLPENCGCCFSNSCQREHPSCHRAMANFLKKFDHFLSRSFYRLGVFISYHYGYFIMIPVFITAILATGFQNIIYQDDPEYLFAPTTGGAKDERALIENYFYLNFSSDFHPSRITRTGRFARFIIVAQDGGTLLRQNVWDEIMEVDRLVHTVEADLEELGGGRYEDLCAIWDGRCYENTILGLNDSMSDIEIGNFSLTYPLMISPKTFDTYVFPLFFGGVELSNSSTITSAKALSITYWLKSNHKKEDQDAAEWENALLDALEKRNFETIEVARFVSRTLETELEKNTNSVIPYFGITVAIMVLFSVGTVMMGDWVRTKPWLGLMGVVSASLACLASFGFLIYLGLEFIGINMAAPFLMLGIGIDDTFVMLAAWRRTNLQDSVHERMGHCFAEAAVSITITSLTDMISFYIGAITPFPCVQIFCLYTGMAVLVTYVWHVTFFGGCMALAGHMEKDQRHGVICTIKVKPVSESKDEGCCYNTFCTGGISAADPWNPEDNKDHALMVFFRDYIARLLNIPAIKALVVMIFLLYLLGACWGCTMVKEGLERRRLSRYDSYSVRFYDLEDHYFRDYPYRIQVVITGDLNYSDPTTQEQLIELHQQFENLTYVAGAFYTESWLRAWLGFLDRNQEYMELNVTTEEDFIFNLRDVYLSGPANPYTQDVAFNEDYTRIVASRFIIQTYKIMDANDDKDMMETLRKVAQDSPFNVTVFNPFFIFFDQFVLVRTTSIQAISLAAGVMMVISLIFIPNPLCSLWVAFSIVSIEVGVVGYMTLWNVNLDSISMINLIMCIGFSVDFSAHISYAYLAAKVDTPDERVQECLYALGVPILQGGLSTILGITALIFAPSYIFITFFKTVFLVIFFGAVHGIFLLPVLLSVLGPGSCSNKKKDNILPPTATRAVGPPFYTQGKPPITTQPESSSLKIPRPHSITHNGSAVSPMTLVSLGKSGAFMAPAASPTNGSNKEDGANYDKDLGLGTSGEESSESSLSKGAANRRGGPDIVNGCGGRPPILEVYSNNGYISDDLEAEERRAQERRLDRYGKWEDIRRSYHSPSKSLGSNASCRPNTSLNRSSSSHVSRGHSHHSNNRSRSESREGSAMSRYGQRSSSGPRGHYHDRH
ncbi:patched domain-containing protein 3-like isoform X2 [Macrobrachium nipponense]|uniref:patched domain-containing protein 3-like isoform X2 n=1 Tax=Macrobrachium nipponense TaxID=159736 RepID=UPI0030C7C8DA